MSSTRFSPEMKSMETTFDNIIFNYPKVPSKQSALVAIPLNMYRIQTNKVRNGMDFFMKAVLRFKAKPGFPNEKIAETLGIKTELVGLISSKLAQEKLLDGNGALTEKGRTALMQMDGLIVDDTMKSIGFVFQYLDDDKFYPFYIKDYRIPETTSDPEPKIKGQKNDGYILKSKMFYAKEILEEKVALPAPDERVVTRLISNLDKRKSDMDDEPATGPVGAPLSMRFLPDNRPTLVWVVTYMYYEEVGDGLFSSDWKVRDPFAEEKQDSSSLKLYLEGNAPELIKQFESEFGDVETIEKKRFHEAATTLQKEVERVLLADFGMLPQRLDRKLQSYIRSVVQYKLEIAFSESVGEDASISFALNMQKAFESIIKKHKHFHNREYSAAVQQYESGAPGDNTRMKGNALNALFQFLFGNRAPSPIYNAAKQRIERPTALKGFMVALLLTAMYNDKLYMMVVRDSDKLIQIANLRNDRSHGQIEEDAVRVILSKEEMEEYYGFFKRFIEEYIQNELYIK